MATTAIAKVLMDTSVVIAVILHEPAREDILSVTRDVELLAARPLEWEAGNALVAALRKRRLTQAQVELAWSSFGQVRYRMVEIDIAMALRTAIAAGIYAYDAYVLEAARVSNATLLTLDRRMEEVAWRLRIPTARLPK
jgi:predicted nucleic acid-binding protein